MMTPPTPAELAGNPLAARSSLPFGFPAFQDVKLEHYRPAIMAVLARGKAEVEAIAALPASYETTILGLERAGQDHGLAMAVFSHTANVMSTPELQALRAELNPLMTKHSTELYQNPQLFEKVRTVYDGRAALGPVEQRLVTKYYEMMLDSGAALNEADKAKFVELSGELSAKSTAFQKKMVDGGVAHAVILRSEEEMAGIPADMRAAMAQAAAKMGHENAYAVTLGMTAVKFLEYSSNRAVREKVWETRATYTNKGDAFDTNADVKEIVALRQSKAKLLGFATHAEYSTARKAAKTPSAAMGLLTSLVEPARAAYDAERAAVTEFAKQSEGFTGELQPWDWPYYARRHEEATIGLTDAQLEPYLELGQVRDAFFTVCEKALGITFTPRTDLPALPDEAQVWELSRADAQHLGLFMTDYLERPGQKRDGAWAGSLRSQNGLTGERPIIVNVCNFPRPAPGKPTLLRLDDAITLFHEGGHALHGLLSNTPAPSLAGTAVQWDVVELPSQFMESMFTHPDLMARHLRHYQTGEPMPAAMIERAQQRFNHNQGNFVLRQLSFGICDLELYGKADAAFDPQTFEQQTLDRYGFPPRFRLRPMLQSFAHIMAGGYSAGYYSYMWADVLVADAEEAFKPDPLNPQLGRKWVDEVHSRGDSRDMGENYRAFRGRDPDPLAIKRRFGWT